MVHVLAEVHHRRHRGVYSHLKVVPPHHQRQGWRHLHYQPLARQLNSSHCY